MRLGMLFRFYFYTFYDFFQKQGIRRGPPRFRASIMVSITLSCLTNSLLIPLKRTLNQPFESGAFLLLLGVSYLFMVYNSATNNERFLKIDEEFSKHRINSIRNRTYGWVFFVLTFFLQIFLALQQKGFVIKY